MTAELDRIRSLHAGITPNWVLGTDRDDRAILAGPYGSFLIAKVGNINNPLLENDAAFIAAAPSTVTQLLAIIERVEKLAKYLDGLADGDKHYAKLIRVAITGEDS